MPTTITPTDRDRVKSVVASGKAEAIDAALTDGTLKRKLYKVAEVDEASSEIVFTVTSDTLDRDSERVLPKSLEKDFAYYEENPVVLFHHDHSIPAVAKMVDYTITEKAVVMRDQFAIDIDYPLAKVLWELYSKGYMRMTSIGFIPIEWTDDDDMMLDDQKGLTFTRVEIIEHSLVNVGANRHAVSELPTKIRSDATLKSAYEEYVESNPKTVGKPDSHIFVPTNNTLASAPTLHLPHHTGEQPINITLQMPELKEVSEPMALNIKQRCPTCEAKATADTPQTKGENLAMLLNNAIGDGDDRADTIDMMATAAGIEASTVNQILDGEIDCPTMDRLEGFAEALSGVSLSSLIEAAESDGCNYDMETDGMHDDDEKAVATSKTGQVQARTKFYGMLAGMFPESMEERQRAVHTDLQDYLEYMIEDIEKYEYVEAYPIATYPDHVIVYCWNTDKIYKATYTMDDNQVEFTDLKQIRLNYEEMEMDMKTLTEAPTETDDSDITD